MVYVLGHLHNHATACILNFFIEYVNRYEENYIGHIVYSVVFPWKEKYTTESTKTIDTQTSFHDVNVELEQSPLKTKKYIYTMSFNRGGREKMGISSWAHTATEFNFRGVKMFLIKFCWQGSFIFKKKLQNKLLVNPLVPGVH